MIDEPQQGATYADLAVNEEVSRIQDVQETIGTHHGVTCHGTSDDKHPGADDRTIGEPKPDKQEEGDVQEGDVDVPEGWYGLAFARHPNKNGVKPSKSDDGTALLLTRVAKDAPGDAEFKVQHFSGRKVDLGEKAMIEMDENAKLVGKDKLAMTWKQYYDPKVHLTLLRNCGFGDDAPEEIHGKICLKEETADGSVERQRLSFWVFKGKATTENALQEWKDLFKPVPKIASGTGAEGSTAVTVRAGNCGGRSSPYAARPAASSWDQTGAGAWGSSNSWWNNKSGASQD